MRHLWIVMLLIPSASAAQDLYVTGSVGQFRQDAVAFGGTGTAAGVAVGTFISPRVTIEGEVVSADGFPREGRVPYSAAGLIGFHPVPTGRVGLGLRIGLGVQRLEWLRTDGGGNTRRLDRSEATLVMGVEVPISLTAALAIVPDIRVTGALAYRDMALRPAVGVRWTF